MRQTLVVLVSLLASTLAAQPLTVGTITPDPSIEGGFPSLAVKSFVNLADPATAAGTVNKASVLWSVGCAGAFKIVFLRNGLSSAATFSVIATRGPFNAVDGRNDVTLTPPVTVAKYDLIGIVQLQPFATCGTVLSQPLGHGHGYLLITSGDISTTGAVGPSSFYQSGYVLGVIAYSADPLLVRVLPAAGAVQGSGAFFRTALQLHNPTNFTAITGKLVFHKAGQIGSDSDPSLTFSLSPLQTVSYADVVTAMGASGLGSLDVFTNGGSPPIVTARVFSDNGVNGTSGFTEEGLPPGEALQTEGIDIGAYVGVLPLPADLTNFRMNIGVRTLDAGATLSASWFGADGSFRGSRNNIIYPPNYFEQTTVNLFTGATNLDPGGTLLIQMSTGAAFVYGTVTDNRTQDSSMRIATEN